MEGDGGESWHSLLSLLPLLLKSMGAAAAHIEVHEVQEPFDSIITGSAGAIGWFGHVKVIWVAGLALASVLLT